MLKTWALETKKLNKKLDEVSASIEEHFLVLKSQHQKITAELLKEAYEGNTVPKEQETIQEVIAPPTEHTICEAFDCFLEDFQDAVDTGIKSYETLKHWKTTRNKIKDFIAYKYKRKDLLLSEVRFQFAADMLKYLTTKVTEPLAEVTAMKHIKCTKQVFSEAVDKEWLNKNPISRFNLFPNCTKLSVFNFFFYHFRWGQPRIQNQDHEENFLQ